MTTYPLIFRFVANRLRDMSRIALMLSFVSVALLGCGGGGGGGGSGTPTVMHPPFTMGTPTMAERTGDERNDVFTITGDIRGTDPTMNLILEGPIDGADGSDEVQLNEGAVAASIAFSDTEPTGGALHLQNIETITISGGLVGSIASGSDALTLNMMSGRVTGGVNGGAGADAFNLNGGTVTGDVNGGAAADTFNLNGGRVNGDVNGGDGDDRFVIGGSVTITGTINGGDGMNTLSLASGFTPDSANLFGDRLTLTLTGGDILTFTLASIEDTSAITGLNMMPLPLAFPAATTGANIFRIIENIVPGDPGQTHTLDFVIDGLGGVDQVWLLTGAVVGSLFFRDTAPDGSGDVHVQNIGVVLINGGRVNGAIDTSSISTPVEFQLTRGTAGAVTGGSGNDTFILRGNMVDGSLTVGAIDGGDNVVGDELRVTTGAVVRSISFNTARPTGGDVRVQNITTININGGMVTGDITGSSDGESFRLQSGTIRGNVLGGDGADIFNLYRAITIGGFIDGGGNPPLNGDTLQYAGDPGETFGTAFLSSGETRGGLAHDPDIGDDDDPATPEEEGGSVRNIETHQNNPVIDSLSVRGIERLALSPALNLYGALSDALMQFGQQTAQGFALADLNPQTGRLTQLVSKDSPFTKGRIWAHKITHAGNGKGSIGLNLTGLTARAASDYDYEMSLTQHGFDAPVVSSQWGDFGLRAVSHTMTGMIETNTAEAQVSGYGAGVSLLWRSRELRSLPRHNLTAHLTALAGGYDVDAHTSPSNPQAVINEVSEGSFSAINAVISAGVADKRELANGLVMRTTADVSWQTLSLDDFTETGADGIIINFDKATRFTARIGAGLESEHWFSDLAFVHETSSGGTLSSGLRQDYRQHDGTAIEMKFGGKMADLASGLTIKAFMAWRQSVSGLAGEPSAQFELSYRF